MEISKIEGESLAGLQGHAEGDIDLIVLNRFFRSETSGTCVEIGAARPDWLSIGALYRAKGWDVVSVEPNPAFCEMHRQLGHSVLQYACGTEDRDDVDFSIVDCGGTPYRDGNVTFESWSSLALKADYAALNPDIVTTQIKVKLRRLDTLLAGYRPAWTGIDLIAADVEGWELEVLSGLDFARYRPKVLIIENLFYKAEYRAFMRKRGYALWRCSPPNDVYVRTDLLSRAETIFGRIRSFPPTMVGRARAFVGRLKRRLRR